MSGRVYNAAPYITYYPFIYRQKIFSISWKNNFDYILIEIKVIISRQFYFEISGTWLEGGHI